MSRHYISECVDCGLPCLGASCRYYRVAVDVCDKCGAENAEYCVDGEDMCKECAKDELKSQFKELNQQEKEKALDITAEKLLEEVFDDLSMDEQAEIVDIDLSEIND